MGKEDYVSLEVAKLLKEKGFDEPCCMMYNEYEESYEFSCYTITKKGFKNSNECDYNVTVPTLYEAQRWLRNKKTYIYALPTSDNGATVWYYEVVNDNDPDDIFYTTSQDTYPNYETALNEGIKYALNSFEL